MHGRAARVVESEAEAERMKVEKEEREQRSEVRRQNQTVNTVASEIVAA
jgi:hypothetical protein